MRKLSIHDDDAQLAAMGHKPELNRNFSMLYAAFPPQALPGSGCSEN